MHPELLMQIGRPCPALRKLLLSDLVSFDALAECGSSCPLFPQLQTLSVKVLVSLFDVVPR
jgi:hypothetical protein